MSTDRTELTFHPRRWRLQFSVRSLLIVVTVFCLVLAVYYLPEFRRRRHQATLQAYQMKWEKIEGNVNSDASCDAEVTSLTLHGNNHLTSLPAEIWDLSNLESLTFNNNNRTIPTSVTLSPEIGKLTDLIELQVTNNRLTNLPPEIWRLTKLKKLSLKGNHLVTLSHQIGNLTDLTELCLAENRLATIPSEIWDLHNLTELMLDGNQFATLPPGIGDLAKLKVLGCSANPLTSFPSEVCRLNSLGELYVGSSGITSLPPEIGELSRLTKLHLSSNKLTLLPPEIGKLTNLKKLYLNDNILNVEEVDLLKTALPNCEIFFED